MTRFAWRFPRCRFFPIAFVPQLPPYVPRFFSTTFDPLSGSHGFCLDTVSDAVNPPGTSLSISLFLARAFPNDPDQITTGGIFSFDLGSFALFVDVERFA